MTIDQVGQKFIQDNFFLPFSGENTVFSEDNKCFLSPEKTQKNKLLGFAKTYKKKVMFSKWIFQSFSKPVPKYKK